MDILLIREGDFFVLRKGSMEIRLCGCCGKRIDARAASHLLSKLHAGNLEWSTLYDAGLLWEQTENDQGKA